MQMKVINRYKQRKTKIGSKIDACFMFECGQHDGSPRTVYLKRVFVVSGGILHNMWYNRSVGYSCLCYFGLSANRGEDRTANIQTVEVETEY